jgi:hypothetical protein
MITREELVLAREALLDRTVAFFALQPEVTGIFLSGSLAAGSADAYSDIDLRPGRTKWSAEPGVESCSTHSRCSMNCAGT